MSSKYWEERIKEKLELVDILTNDQVEKMNSLMNKVVSNIDTEIAKLYVKYGKDTGISYYETLMYLKDDERREFQKNLKYYIEKAKDRNNLDKYRNDLQILSTRARVKRLEVLQARIRMGASDIEGFLKNDNISSLNDIYIESYLHNMFSIEGAKGIELRFDIPNNDITKKLLEYPWSGKNYSKKIWDITRNFVDKMDSIVTTGLIQGKPYRAISKELEKANLGKNGNGGLRFQCERLIRTEAAFITEQATKDNYNRDGIEEYEFSATLDLRTSDICSTLDNKLFKVKDAVVGVNYPPMHSHCRSTTVPKVKWEGEESEEDVRIYRDPLTGKNHFAKVRDYAEWKDMQYQKYGEDKVNSEQKKIRNRASDKIQYDKYKSVLGKYISVRNFDEFQEMKYNNINEWAIKKREYATINSINNKNWSEIYKERIKLAYYHFRKSNIELSWHGSQRFVDRSIDKKGNVIFSQKDIVKILNDKPNYRQSDGRFVYFKNGIAIIMNSETNEIVSIVVRRNPKEEWIKID
jgi:SPP1 gp7 family putative phage head morphogenesis protein